MMGTCPLRRSLALVLAVVLAVVLAAPARAEADALTLLAITSLALTGVLIIGYLVVANVEDARRGDAAGIVWLACAASDCAVRAPAARPDDAGPAQAP